MNVNYSLYSFFLPCKIIFRFCLGSTCKRCSSGAYKLLENPAIDKLHSSWINDDILAMQRLSDPIITDGQIIEQFQEKNIRVIFNLTEPGEV